MSNSPIKQTLIHCERENNDQPDFIFCKSIQKISYVMIHNLFLNYYYRNREFWHNGVWFLTQGIFNIGVDNLSSIRFLNCLQIENLRSSSCIDLYNKMFFQLLVWQNHLVNGSLKIELCQVEIENTSSDVLMLEYQAWFKKYSIRYRHNTVTLTLSSCQSPCGII